jgi:hypothetical protein
MHERPLSGGGAVATRAAAVVAGARLARPRLRAVVLVEGASDQRALAALAVRRGRDLEAEGVRIVAMGGVTNIGHFLHAFRELPPGIRLGGLCDAGEERVVGRQLERAGFGAGLDRPRLERLGFFVCEADLEDELVRALGVAAVERVIETQGELGAWRTFQQQPAQRGRSDERRLRRFLGTRSGRKAAYGALLVEALDLTDVPRPLDLVLAAV